MAVTSTSLLSVFEYNQHFVAMMDIINQSRLNVPENGDVHHIVPRCWFIFNKLNIDNSDSNLVKLSIENHRKIHKLASLCSKEKWLRNKMLFAYNLMSSGEYALHDGMKGKTHKDATKNKMSELSKARWETEEYRNKLVKAHSNKKQTKEHIEKRVNKLKGQKRTPEQRSKISEALKGRVLSTEQKKKISISKMGKTIAKLGGDFYFKFVSKFGAESLKDKKLYNREKAFYYRHNKKCKWEV